MTDLVTRFAALFDGRHDAYGLDHGECLRTEGLAVTHAGWVQAHLAGEQPIGVYPLVPNLAWAQGDQRGPLIDGESSRSWCVKWGCVDLDVKGPSHATGYDAEDEAHTAACNIVKTLEVLQIAGWIERTRSCGRHVWVFAEQWVPAKTTRDALLVACEVAGVPPTEVNPKQTRLEAGQMGNYVRLPYPGELSHATQGITSAPTRRAVLGAYGIAMPLARFLAEAEQHLAPLSVFAEAAKLYRPKVESTASVHIVDVGLTDSAMKRLNGLAFVLHRDGPIGEDRSAYLYKLAACCRDSGLAPGEAVAIVADADQKHTQKYSTRRDAQDRYEQTVRKAYT